MKKRLRKKLYKRGMKKIDNDIMPTKKELKACRLQLFIHNKHW